jgi:hypothetical protein
MFDEYKSPLAFRTNSHLLLGKKLGKLNASASDAPGGNFTKVAGCTLKLVTSIP